MKRNYSFSLMADDRKQFTFLAKEVLWLLFLWSILFNKKLPSFVQHDPKEFVISWSGRFPAGFFSVQKTQLMMLQLDNVACLGPMDARTNRERVFGGVWNRSQHVEYHSV